MTEPCRTRPVSDTAASSSRRSAAASPRRPVRSRTSPAAARSAPCRRTIAARTPVEQDGEERDRDRRGDEAGPQSRRAARRRARRRRRSRRTRRERNSPAATSRTRSSGRPRSRRRSGLGPDPLSRASMSASTGLPETIWKRAGAPKGAGPRLFRRSVRYTVLHLAAEAGQRLDAAGAGCTSSTRAYSKPFAPRCAARDAFNHQARIHALVILFAVPFLFLGELEPHVLELVDDLPSVGRTGSLDGLLVDHDVDVGALGTVRRREAVAGGEGVDETLRARILSRRGTSSRTAPSTRRCRSCRPAPLAMYSSTSGTMILADFVSPNCADWFTQFAMSLPNSVMHSTSGLAACASANAAEKSVVPSLSRTFLIVFPPLGSTIDVMLS